MFSWSKRHSERTVARIEAAFPSHLSVDVRAALQIVPKAEHEPTEDDAIGVFVDGERLWIPYRVYFPEPQPDALSALTAQQRLVLAAIFTRHHNGLVRERWLRELRPPVESWIPPFVVQLLGEYILEIGLAIEQVVPSDQGQYRVFADANGEFCRLVSARMINYWALYYRRRTTFTDYPAYRAACRLGVWRGRPPRRRTAR